jgi:DNA-binding winged helix-turn-helix (wHTH) protein
MGTQTGYRYEFGPFRLDAGARLLLREGEPVPLTPKAVETLIALVESGGQMVSREELLKRVWPDTYVEENNLSVSVSMLRKALGQTAEGRPYIETLPRRGYRFAAEVRQVGATAPG